MAMSDAPETSGLGDLRLAIWHGEEEGEFLSYTVT